MSQSTPDVNHARDTLSVALHRRRVMFEILESAETEYSLHELAVETLRELGREEAESEVQQLAVRLHHADLPKLVDDGVISYDPVSHTIRPE